MNGNTQNRLVSSALEKLKRAVLSVLSEQYVEGSPDKPYLRIRDIRERLGLPMLCRHNSLTHGILMHLAEDGHAEKLVGRKGLWQIIADRIPSRESGIPEMVSSGLGTLKSAALDALHDQYREGRLDKPYLRIDDVREQLGLPKLGGHNNLTHGILMHLAEDGHAEWLGEGGRWQITEKGISSIKA